MAESINQKDEKNQNIDLDHRRYEEVRHWSSKIQKALSIESENDFANIKGKAQIFNEFISAEIVSFSPGYFLNDIKKQLKFYSLQFKDYPVLTIEKRRKLIVRTRQYIYNLSRNFKPKESYNPPKLKLPNTTDHLKKSSFNVHNEITLQSPLSVIKGIGPKMIGRFASMGIYVVGELLNYYPRDYVDYSSLKRIFELEEGQTATVIATIRRSSGFVSPKNPNLAILDLQLFDKTGRLKVTRFLAGRRFSNQSYIRTQTRLFPVGAIVAVSGLVKNGPYGKVLNDPLIEVLENNNSVINSKKIGQLLPVYSLKEGITADRFRDFIEIILPLTSLIDEPLKESRLKTLNLITKKKALIAIHKPVDHENLKDARRRLVFEEFLLLQLGLLRRRFKNKALLAPSLDLVSQEGLLVSRFLDLLPFSLTNSQNKVLAEIQKDISSNKPMARLLQGDVGSGKTVVALAALMHVVQAGFQGALMAPTEVLAEQHYQNFCKWLPHLHITVELLTGSTSKSRRKKILSDLNNGTLKILVGTHALIEDPVSFLRLGLVVVDEQHRFGVKQRNRLLGKGLQPHLLAMTATPIPRTLALSIYGDLDVSQINELPPGRTPVKTRLLAGNQREEAYNLIEKLVQIGQRAYVVLPLVEESEKLDLRSAVDVYKLLSEEVFPDFNVGLLHGRMTSVDKQSIISDFSKGNCQILVSTTVVEVGVDVPDATVMMVDNADRFGLAQLHQLRGRVGRGTQQSYCLLINDSKNPLARQRLEVLENSNDGFEISEIDLRLRGPGQVLGTRQSGLPDFALASLSDDSSILEEAREEALYLLHHDPDLLEHKTLENLLNDQWKRLSASSNLN